MYANTPSENDNGIRAGIGDTCVKHVRQLLSRKLFLALIEEGGDFAVDITRALAEH